MTNIITDAMPVLHGETGTEGNYFAVQRNPENKKWSYEDLFLLKNGDYLVIYYKSFITETIMWKGYVNLDLNHDLSMGHGYQRGKNNKYWGKYFNTGGRSTGWPYRCLLVRK